MDSKIKILKATKKDRWKIRFMVWSACLNPIGLIWRRFVVSLDSSGRVIACGQIKVHRDGSNELSSLVVSPQFRGQGFARSIVEYLIREHSGSLYLICKGKLAGFYKKFGFRLVNQDELPPYFSRVHHLTSLFLIFAEEENSLLIMRRDC